MRVPVRHLSFHLFALFIVQRHELPLNPILVIAVNVVVNCMSTNNGRNIWVKNCNFVKSSNMSTIELRHIIVEKLSQIDDASFLRAIKTIVESKANEDVYKLSDFQKKRIKESREQVKLGQTISNDALQKEIKEWLSTK